MKIGDNKKAYFVLFLIGIISSSNKSAFINSFLYALPASGMLAEAIACLIVLYNNHMLLAQTIFDKNLKSNYKGIIAMKEKTL